MNVMVLPLTVKESPDTGPVGALTELLVRALISVAPVATVVEPPVKSVEPAVPVASCAPTGAIAAPATEPMMPPSVSPLVAAVTPPLAPENRTLPDAAALTKLVVPRRSSAVAPAIVVDTLDFLEKPEVVC